MVSLMPVQLSLKHCDAMVSIPAFYFGGLGFESESRDQIS
jgi:hypothetical protein